MRRAFIVVATEPESPLRVGFRQIIALSFERGRLGREADTYLHIPIVAGIVIAAVGLELVVAHPDVALEGS